MVERCKRGACFFRIANLNEGGRGCYLQNVLVWAKSRPAQHQTRQDHSCPATWESYNKGFAASSGLFHSKIRLWSNIETNRSVEHPEIRQEHSCPGHLGVLKQKVCLLAQACWIVQFVIGQVIHELIVSVCYLMEIERY